MDKEGKGGLATALNIFKDLPNAQAFDRDGFVILPFLNAVEVRELNTLYARYRPPYSLYKIYSNLEDNSKETNLHIEATINSVFQPHIDKYFANYKFYGGSFLVKGIGPQSVCNLHQDWNAVDETENISFSIWVPLEDTNEQNGCLKVVPGSHRWFSTIRSANISSLYIDLDERIMDWVRSVPVKAGTAVVFAQNLFHGSKENYTDHARVAVHTVLVNKTAELVHYIAEKEKERILEVHCGPDFLYDNIFNISKGIIPNGLNILREITDEGQFKVNEAAFRAKAHTEFNQHITVHAV